MADTDQPRSGLVAVTSDVPPPLPVRSPLRQRHNLPALQVEAMPGISSLNTILDALDAIAADTNKNKPMPPLPTDNPAPKDTDHDTDKASPSPTSPELPTPNASPALTKRQHALHELLSSERAYASDLALIKEVHIPLALGQTEGVPNLPITPPNSSGPSSRTVSTVSDTSSPPSPPPGPPMTPDDVKIIFGNIAEIALFSDLFCQELEEALGALLEGGQGEDRVGALFLRIIPELERPYKQYITRHPTALTQLQQLPQTPALQHYLIYTRSIASSLSHAWDLSSLLIKPVQRLLKYPLLLTAIIDETPDRHPDKENLREAHKKMEEVARNVNEGRRRAEVIRDVLASKKKSVGVGVSASVNLTKMKSLRVSSGKSATTTKDKDAEKTSEEAALVEKLEKELKAIEEFAQKFAKNIVDWARMARNVVATLRTWAISFGKVIGLTEEQGSEAFDQFMVVIEQQLTPLCADLEATINERVLKELAHLLMTMSQPLKLLDSMNEQEPYHHHLLNMTVSAKNRPPPSLLAASTNYLALRGQLAAELPTYVSLLHRGLLMFVMRTAEIQQDFYGTMRKYWEDLWEMLRVEGEMNAGHEETMNVWWGRWNEVEKFLHTCAIVQDPKVWREIEKTRLKERERERQREREKEEQFAYQTQVQEPNHRGRYSSSSSSSAPHRGSPAANSTLSSFEQSHSSHKRVQAAKVGSMLESLAPSPSVSSMMSATTIAAAASLYSSTSIVGPYVAPPLSLPSRSHERDYHGRRVLGRKTSMDSLRSSGTAKSPTSRGRYRGEYHDQQENLGSRDYYDHGSSRQPYHPGIPRRRTTGPARPEDLDEYNVSQQELEYDRERNRRRAGYGYSAHVRESEEYDPEYPRSRDHVRPVVTGPGLPRMRSMPSPYQHQAPPGGWRGRETGKENARESSGSGEWDYVDEDDVQYYGKEAGYGDHYLDSSRIQRRGMDERRARERAEGEAEEESKRYSEYSQHSQKSRDKSRAREREKPREKSREKELERPREKGKYKEIEKEERKEKERDSSDKKDKDKRPSSSRKRSGSIKQFFTSNRDSHHSDSKERRKSRDKEKDSDADSNPLRAFASPRDSWALKPAKYLCQVIYPCQPPPVSSSPGAPPVPITYFAFPFFTLKEGELYEVIQEAGHPSLHPRLPLVVDEGEDCLLLCRNCEGTVGWALASFLEPVEIDR